MNQSPSLDQDSGSQDSGSQGSESHGSGSQGSESHGFWRSRADGYCNLDGPRLSEIAIEREEAKLTRDDSICAHTGIYTGRSPKDKFIVRDDETENRVDWSNNQSISRSAFDLLKDDLQEFCKHKQFFGQRLQAGADQNHSINVEIITSLAWHSMFIRNMLIVPDEDFDTANLTIVDVPEFEASADRYGVNSGTLIACDLTNGHIIIVGTEYAGEIKKSVFSYLNYSLPPKGVFPMHCSANIGSDGNSAIFFGLSGTGKTTISADPSRRLVGDDEHAWTTDGLYNIEGGCYAKTYCLTEEEQPLIFRASTRAGTVLENVVLSSDKACLFGDNSISENGRAAYPLSYLANIEPSGLAPHPNHIIMLTADAFGILPPISRLSTEQAIYHFLSGYTAKLAGTERGIKEPEATFSTCFGAPFMPLMPQVYGDMLRSFIDTHHTRAWLVNTGWIGGPYGIGSRIDLSITRNLIDAILCGELDQIETRHEPHFGLEIPNRVRDLDEEILIPELSWPSSDDYRLAAIKLKRMFDTNMEALLTH